MNRMQKNHQNASLVTLQTARVFRVKLIYIKRHIKTITWSTMLSWRNCRKLRTLQHSHTKGHQWRRCRFFERCRSPSSSSRCVSRPLRLSLRIPLRLCLSLSLLLVRSLSLSLSLCLFLCLPLSLRPSVCFSLCFSLCLSLSSPLRLSLCLSRCLSLCLSLQLSGTRRSPYSTLCWSLCCRFIPGSSESSPGGWRRRSGPAAPSTCLRWPAGSGWRPSPDPPAAASPRSSVRLSRPTPGPADSGTIIWNGRATPPNRSWPASFLPPRPPPERAETSQTMRSVFDKLLT